MAHSADEALQERLLNTFRVGVEDCIRRSPFFRAWVPHLVDARVAGRFLAAFDGLVRTFPKMIALGAARAEDEDTRTILATNLYQECGEGDVRRTHHAIFRNFLATAGVDPEEGEQQPFTNNWRTSLLQYIETSRSVTAAVGALAAGSSSHSRCSGEFLI